jgi:energy-coupling factor transport system ATP-binding protein
LSVNVDMPITLQDVSYKYPGTLVAKGDKRAGWALRHINLEIQPGELIGLIGQNGSGKSTLCLTLNGLIPHFFHGDLRGKVLIDGVSTVDVELYTLITQVGVLFQNPFDQLTGVAETVLDEVAFGPENLGLVPEETLRRVNKSLAAAGVSQLAERNPFQLSGGQQQRVALASVLAMEPRILVLDEPTSQLDPIGSDEVFQVIRGLHAQGYTILLAEHKVDALAELATRAIVMAQGAIVMDGSPREVLTNPELSKHQVLPPRYTALSQALAAQGIHSAGQEPLTLDEAVVMLKGILSDVPA